MFRKFLIYATIVLGAAMFVLYGLLPRQTITLLGYTANDAAVLLSRFFGSAQLGIAVMVWAVRNADAETQNPVLLGLFISLILLLVISLIEKASGGGAPIVWAAIIGTVIAIIAFGYELFGSKQ
jgi:hypothetical protein